MIQLWKNANYTAPIQYLIDIPISEYDITKANISVLRDANVLSEDQYQYYLVCPKIEREIAIGRMQGSNIEITNILKSGIMNARKIFMESNNLSDKDILAIRNDSLTVMTDRPMKIDITDRVRFRLSGQYRSFYKINTLFMYYDFNVVSKKEILDIKGLGESGINFHKNFILEFLSELFYTAQIEGVKEAIKLLSIVYSNYINMDLPIQYYRELNSLSMFRFKKEFYPYTNPILADFVSERDKKYIDISWNESIFRLLNKYFSSIYFKKK